MDRTVMMYVDNTPHDFAIHMDGTHTSSCFMVILGPGCHVNTAMSVEFHSSGCYCTSQSMALTRLASPVRLEYITGESIIRL